MNPRIVVVGGLAAGPTAAAKAKRTSPGAEVHVFESGEHISYGICEIPYMIAGAIANIQDLELYTPERFQRDKGVTVHTLHQVEEIHAGRRFLSVRDFRSGKKKEVPYDRLILATGSTPRRLGMQGENARNVFAIKSLSESAALRKFIEAEKPTNAVIVGGGYIGMEMAEALRKRSIAVTVLHRHAQPMWGLEEPTRSAVDRELAANGVTFVPSAAVKSLDTGEKNTVTRVITAKASIPADLVIICIGVTPNTWLAKTAGIRLGDRGGILTDRRQVTSVDGIYAAGDCCEVRSLVTNQWTYVPLATVASRQARVAGENAAGGSSVFRGALRSIAVRVFSLEVARVGLSSSEARESGFDPVVDHIEANSRIPLMGGSERNHVITIADRKSGRILGANLFGRDGVTLRANTMAVAIQEKLTAGQLSDLDLIYSPPFSPLWDPLLIAGNHLKKQVGS